jgi:hypothetical protein
MPDGSGLLALRTNGDLVVTDLESRAPRVVASSLTLPTGGPGVFVDVAPEGRSVAVGRHDADGLTAVLELVDIASGRARSLAAFEVVGAPVPVFAGDGSEVYAFVTDGARPSDTRLYAIALDGSAPPRQIADLSVEGDASAWIGAAVAHPTAPWLVFVQDGALRAVNVEDGATRELAPRGEQVVRGDPVVTTGEAGDRVAYIASAYLGPSGAEGDVEPIGTAFAVHSEALTLP